jgi:hypothetical protein
MPIWSNRFRTARLQADQDDYKEGYHKGHPDGLDNVDTDLKPVNVMLGVNIFGTVGTLLWKGLEIAINVISSVTHSIVSVAQSILVTSAPTVALEYQLTPTATVEPTTSVTHAIVTVDDSVAVSSVPTAPKTYAVLDAMGGAVADDGGVETDETTAANNDTANDMTLLPSTPAVGDAYDFGYASTFGGIEVKIDTPGVGTWDITWYYWNGAWTALADVVDDTNAFRPTVSGTITRYNVRWTIPGDWALKTIQSKNLYWVRAEVTSYTSKTTQPKGTRCYIETAIG